MALKIGPASPEEHAFACQVNDRLVTIGAKVLPFEMVNSENGERHYHLTFQCGSKRTVVTADTPFHYDSVDDVVRQVQQWLATAGAGERWTTDLEKADGPDAA
jgi:hypothetical protein